jgi:predicted nucleic-acid-binding Zn-ribbon protein
MLLSVAKCEEIKFNKNIEYGDFYEKIKSQINIGNSDVAFSIAENLSFKYKYELPILDINKRKPWHDFVSGIKDVSGYTLYTIECRDNEYFFNQVRLDRDNVSKVLIVKNKLCLIIKCKKKSKPFEKIDIFNMLYSMSEGRYIFSTSP